MNKCCQGKNFFFEYQSFHNENYFLGFDLLICESTKTLRSATKYDSM